MIRICFVLLLFSIVGCAEIDNTAEELEDNLLKSSVHSELDQVGIIHNQAMDEIITVTFIDSLREIVVGKDGVVDSIEIYEILIAETNNFTQSLSPLSIRGTSYSIPELTNSATFYKDEFNNNKDAYLPFQTCVVETDGIATSNCISNRLDEMITENASDSELAAVSILLHSMRHWSSIPEGGLIVKSNGNGQGQEKRGCLNWWSIGFADYTGAGSGSALGPGGALAGGILNSGVAATISALSSCG